MGERCVSVRGSEAVNIEIEVNGLLGSRPWLTGQIHCDCREWA